MKTRTIIAFANAFGICLNVLALSICALATSSAWAADWTLSENTTLTEDMTVDALTVDSGVTLDLNGYKLTCTSLSGEGTITSPGEDLTTSGGTCAMASPSAVHAGSVAALFDDEGQTSYSTSHRIILNQNNNDHKLPLMVDYDFGDGNAKVVNAYKIWAAWSKRAPKAWTLYGSNNSSAYGAASDDGWVEIDSHIGETSWTQGDSNITPEGHIYFCDNSTAYRYYRLKVTAHNGQQYFEMVQLEYFKAGELHLNVASGSAAWPASITFSGNVKVVKEGEGTLAASGDLNIDEGALVVKSGAVTVGGVMNIGNASGKTAAVQIDGGTLTVNTTANEAIKVGGNGTGTLTINGGTMSSTRDTYLAYESGSAGTLNLNGGTLVTRRVLTKYGSSRTLNFNGGTLKTTAAVSSNGVIANGVTVNVGERGGAIDSGNSSDATSGSRVFVAAALGQAGDTGAMTFMGGKTINVEGAVNYTGGTIVELGTKIVANATTARDRILANLVVDGSTKSADENDIVVFECSAGGVTADNVTFRNCGTGTTKKVSEGGTQILVDFKAAWATISDNTTWSALETAAGGAPATDARVIIEANSDCQLTIDKDVTVGQIAFTGTGAVTLSVASGKTLTTGDITGAGGILNNGTIVKTGSGMVSWPFDNNSAGITQIDAGIVKVASVANDDKKTYGFRPDDTTQQLIDVKAGATFDMNGKENFIPAVRLAKGAHFVNTGSTIGYRAKQAVQLILDGDADVSTAGGEFGLIAPSSEETRLDLGANTLTISGSKVFRLKNTTITGTGTINVTGGTLTFPDYASSTGNDCTVAIDAGGSMLLGDGSSLTVKNFTNGNTILTTKIGTLTVTGTLTPGNEIPKLTLSDGATVKASATVTQVVSTTFSATGACTIDASAITKEQLDAATDQRIPVLTVPTANKGGTWTVDNAPVADARAKWVDDGDDTSTLYLCKPHGMMIIFR